MPTVAKPQNPKTPKPHTLENSIVFYRYTLKINEFVQAVNLLSRRQGQHQHHIPQGIRSLEEFLLARSERTEHGIS